MPAPFVSLVLEIPCMMFASSLTTYGTEFLVLESKTYPTTQTQTKSFVQSTEVQLDEKLKPLIQAEEILN